MAGETRGRYSLLTKEVHESIIAAIRGCANLTEAGEAAGISRSTVWSWHAQGAKDSAAGVESVYRTFFEDVRLAKAQLAVYAKARVLKHAAKHYQAADRIMQITDPTTIPQVRIHVTNELTTAIDSLEEAFADDPDQPITRRQALEVARSALLGEYLPATSRRGETAQNAAAGLHPEGDTGLHEADAPDAVDQPPGEDSGG